MLSGFKSPFILAAVASLVFSNELRIELLSLQKQTKENPLLDFNIEVTNVGLLFTDSLGIYDGERGFQILKSNQKVYIKIYNPKKQQLAKEFSLAFDSGPYSKFEKYDKEVINLKK